MISIIYGKINTNVAIIVTNILLLSIRFKGEIGTMKWAKCWHYITIGNIS